MDYLPPTNSCFKPFRRRAEKPVTWVSGNSEDGLVFQSTKHFSLPGCRLVMVKLGVHTRGSLVLPVCLYKCLEYSVIRIFPSSNFLTFWGLQTRNQLHHIGVKFYQPELEIWLYLLFPLTQGETLEAHISLSAKAWHGLLSRCQGSL